MKRLITATATMLAATTWAMPTKTELEQAQRLVQSLTADEAGSSSYFASSTPALTS